MGGEYKMRVTLTNKWGLHAKTAFKFAKEAMKYESTITVVKDKMSADAKQMGDLLMLCAECGDTLVITAVGEDAEKASSNLAMIVSSQFGEE